MMSGWKSCLVAGVLFALSAAPGRAASTWVEQGPGPIFNGGDEGLPGNPVAGAINAIATVPGDPDMLYVGAVNGGIWLTLDATSPAPIWTPLTDQALPALAIASLAVSPANPSVVFAGTGSTSSLSDQGSPGYGVARSTDGGKTWSVLAESTFARQRIVAIVPTTLGGGSVVLAATRPIIVETGNDQDAAINGVAAAAGTADPPAYGLYLSNNAMDAPRKVAFTLLSGASGSGLPGGGVSALVADPANPERFYAGLSAADGAGTAAGVYVTDNGGLNWKPVNGAGASVITGLANSERILLAVHNDPNNDVVYAAVIDNNENLSGVFRSADGGETWTSLGIPSPPILGQGNTHSALVADPTNPNVVFIAGSSQNDPFPNANGCRTYSAIVYRGDASQSPGNTWQTVVCDGARGTSPHADARMMVFDANGDLLQSNDGGIYKLINPDNSATRKWISLIGTIRPTEFHSVAYDPLSRVVFGGTQDNGTTMQTNRGSFSWNEFASGDGGVVAIDADQQSHPGTTLRYSSTQFLGFFNRSTWDAANNFLSQSLVGLSVTNGPCAGQTLTTCIKAPFYTPYVLDAIDPSRMLIGADHLYESFDGGDTLNDLGGIGKPIGTGTLGQPIAYGGALAGKAYPGVFYAGAGDRILHRVARGQPIMILKKYPGSSVQTIVINPRDYREVFVLDSRKRVWASFDEGAHWTNMTGNLRGLTAQVATIGIAAPSSAGSEIVLLAGGFGVFELRHPHGSTTWRPLGKGLPNALFVDLHYHRRQDVLLAGSAGRGAWTLSGFFGGQGAAIASSGPAAGPATLLSEANGPAQDDSAQTPVPPPPYKTGLPQAPAVPAPATAAP